MRVMAHRSTTLEAYADIVLSIATLCNKERLENPKPYKGLHIWYLYRQAFYGFAEFIDWKTACRASERALEKYREEDPSGDIRTQKWSDQPRFDNGRQKGKFHLEHVYTGDMFRGAIETLPEKERTPQNITRLIQDNYCVAWILKKENALLPRSNRGKTLEDAINIYSRHGIRLL